MDGTKVWTAGVGCGVVDSANVVDGTASGVVVMTAGALVVLLLLAKRVRAGKRVDRPARADKVVVLPDSVMGTVADDSLGDGGAVELSGSTDSTLEGMVVSVAMVVDLAGEGAVVETKAARGLVVNISVALAGSAGRVPSVVWPASARSTSAAGAAVVASVTTTDGGGAVVGATVSLLFEGADSGKVVEWPVVALRSTDDGLSVTFDGRVVVGLLILFLVDPDRTGAAVVGAGLLDVTVLVVVELPGCWPLVVALLMSSTNCGGKKIVSSGNRTSGSPSNGGGRAASSMSKWTT